MPLLADTIVECGRRTLTNAINMANTWGRDPNGRWRGAEVIYGDTDSLFIKLPGRSVQEAFLFGEDFCKAVTESNPPPVQLKLEKVGLCSTTKMQMICIRHAQYVLMCFTLFIQPGLSRVNDANEKEILWNEIRVERSKEACIRSQGPRNHPTGPVLAHTESAAQHFGDVVSIGNRGGESLSLSAVGSYTVRKVAGF